MTPISDDVPGSRRSVVTPSVVHEHARKKPRGTVKLTEGTGELPGERLGGFIIPNRRRPDPELAVQPEPDEIA
jgi:hypothetical protein